MDSTSLPTGTVTFLFTDIEGSTRLWEQHPEAMRDALSRHNALLADGIRQHGGVVVKSRGEGDSFFAVFARAIDAMAAATALQQVLLVEPWPIETPLRVRMALHTGEADLQGGDYFGPAVNRCARLRAVAHGGQVLLSQSTADRVQEHLTIGTSLRDLGSHRLKDLQQPEHLFQLLHPDLSADFPPVRSLEVFAHNLPVQLTSFIGREEAMAEVKRLLATAHLLTLTGSGGCGKTRLALQVAADRVEEYADGVRLVELAALADPSLVPQSVAAALGVREDPGRPLTATLIDYLRSRSLLLVLDNCEHLLSACAQLVESLLQACPSLRVLASSREGLGVSGEQTYRVPSLSLPGVQADSPERLNARTPERLMQYEAVQLFAARAALSQPSFAVTAANAAAVAQVCRRLDGIPLAIELAAARVSVLPVEQIAARLDDRFRLLTGGSRTALPRQQTLRALIDWSYNLLTEPERVLLRRLSVFVGGWSLEAAEAVCAEAVSGAESSAKGQQPGIEAWEVLELLSGLVSKSLVLYEERGTEGRYRFMETVRQYGRERLLEAGESAAVRQRHEDYFLQWVESIQANAAGESERAGLDRVEREHDNLRAVLEWARVGSHDETLLRLMGAVGWAWHRCGHLIEGRQWLEEALSRSQHLGSNPLRASALMVVSNIAFGQGDFGAAHALTEQLLEMQNELGNKWAVGWCYWHMGVVARDQAEYDRSRSYYRQCLAIREAIDDTWGITHVLNDLGYVTYLEGDCRTARALLEQNVERARQWGHSPLLAISRYHLAEVADTQGSYSEAAALLKESLAYWQEVGYEMFIALLLYHQGRVALHQGDLMRARSQLVESLLLQRKEGSRWRVTECLESLGTVCAAEQRPERAARLFAVAAGIRAELGIPIPPVHRDEFERQAEAVRAALGEAAFAAAWAEGQAMALEQTIAYALAE